MNAHTEFQPSPTPSRAFPALRSMPGVKTPPPEFEHSAADALLDTGDRALAALERARALRYDLADLSVRAR